MAKTMISSDTRKRLIAGFAQMNAEDLLDLINAFELQHKYHWILVRLKERVVTELREAYEEEEKKGGGDSPEVVQAAVIFTVLNKLIEEVEAEYETVQAPKFKTA